MVDDFAQGLKGVKVEKNQIVIDKQTQATGRAAGNETLARLSTRNNGAPISTA